MEINWSEVAVGIIVGIVSGIIAGALVNILNKRRARREYVYSFWMNYLFSAMQHCEIWIPMDSMHYIDDVGKKEVNGMKRYLTSMEL